MRREPSARVEGGMWRVPEGRVWIPEPEAEGGFEGEGEVVEGMGRF